MREIDLYVFCVDLMSVIFQSVFSHFTHAPPQASRCGAPSVTTCHDRYRLLTPCHCHIFDRKVLCFFSRKVHVHIRLLRRNVLFVVYTQFHKWLPEINKNNVHPTSKFTPVRSADSSLRDCVVREIQRVDDILGKPV